MEEFETIKHARAMLAAIPKSSASEKTKAGYQRTMQRLNATAKSGAGIIANASKTRKISTWFSRRAAIIYTTRDLVERLMKTQDAMQRELRGAGQDDPRWREWRATVREIKPWASFLKQAYEVPAIPKTGRVARHSKRQDLKGLPADWREKIIKRLPAYAPATLIAAVTGCRPDELVSGVTLSIDNGHLVALIRGSKTTGLTGQSWRRLLWPENSESGMVRELARLVVQNQVSGGWEVNIKSAKAFSGAMRAAGKREWPGRPASITPYCLRHQAAADMKAAGTLSSGEIAAALGHCSDVMKSAYGHALMGRTGGVSPVKVLAARPIKRKAVSDAAFRRSPLPQKEGNHAANLPENSRG
jgi:integrase